MTLAVVGAIVGEWAGADKGLGVLINLARGSLFDIPLMFATLLTIALVGIALYVVVVLVERRLVGEPAIPSPPIGGLRVPSSSLARRGLPVLLRGCRLRRRRHDRSLWGRWRRWRPITGLQFACDLPTGLV